MNGVSDLNAGGRALSRLLRPKSVAIVGASPKPRSLGGNILSNFRAFRFDGDLHLVSATRDEIDGIPCVRSIDDLPEGVDMIALIVPSEAVLDSVRAAARRKSGGVVIFSAGFAETGDDGRRVQEEIAAVVREAGMAMIGPNCLGFTNFLDGVPATFEPVTFSAAPDKGAAVITQSGAMMGNLRIALMARGLPVAYAVSTGNEAATSAEDVMAVLVDDPRVTQLVVFVEQIQQPARFLRVVGRARKLGKPVLLMHPGRSERSREAALSHTGGMAGDHAVMSVIARAHGVVLAEGFDELFDSAAILARFPDAAVSSVGIMSNSGAVRGFTLDFCDSIELALPKLAEATCAKLATRLPDFATVDNPLDITAQGMKDPDLFGDTTAMLLEDSAIDAVVVAVIGGSTLQIMNKWHSLWPVFETARKPVAYAVLGDEHPMPQEFLDAIAESGTPFFRSPERALRAFKAISLRGTGPAPVEVTPLRAGKERPISEARGKDRLAGFGVAIPAGRLARDLEEARTVAAEIGYPVVAKAQADQLMHKSDAGGVVLGIGSDDELAAAWERITASVARHAPGVVLDGLLIEAQSARPEAELILGARRVDDWGGVLMVGMGGIWAEAFGDLRLLPLDADETAIAGTIHALKGAAMLTGGRGRAPLDIAAAARLVRQLGDLVAADTRIKEIEINPVALYPEGVAVLDALLTVVED